MKISKNFFKKVFLSILPFPFLLKFTTKQKKKLKLTNYKSKKREQSMLLHTLKLLCTSLIAPSLRIIFDAINTKYPFEGIDNSWRAVCIVDELYHGTVEISVIHTKAEKAKILETDQYFEFEWKNTISWTNSMYLLSPFYF